MTSAKKKHHTTPEMYLKNFAGSQPQGKIWVYDKTNPVPFAGLPSNVGHQRYFYAAKNAEGEIDNRLEDFLSTIEGKATPILGQLLAGHIPTDPQERHDFSTFLSLLYFRTPTMRRISAEMHSRSMENTLYMHAKHGFEAAVKGMEKKFGKTYSQEEKDKLKDNWLNPGKFELHVPAEKTLDIICTADKLTPMLEKMHWTLMYPKHGFLITCDNPMFKSVDPTTVHPLMGDGGFCNESIEITVPLSPQKALLLTRKPILAQEIEMTREQVDVFNDVRAFAAERFVYSHIKHKKLSKLVAQHKSSSIQFTMSGAGPKKYSKTVVKPPARD